MVYSCRLAHATLRCVETCVYNYGMCAHIAVYIYAHIYVRMHVRVYTDAILILVRAHPES